jgi:hypothetical protein
MNPDETPAPLAQSTGKVDPSGPLCQPSRWLALAVLLITVLVIVVVRIRLLDIPLERDEGEYAYIGQLVLEGVPPYQLAGNMKMPGIYLAYAAIMAVFGQTPAGIHLGLLLVNLAILPLVFFVARPFLDFYGAAIATVAYGLMLLSPAYLGLAAHASNFAVLFALPGLLMLLRLKENAAIPPCLGAGIFFGISFVMNQPGAAFGIFGGLYLLWILIARKTAGRNIVLRLGIFALGGIIPFLAVCLWLKITGAFSQFCFWTFTYAREYATAHTFQAALVNAEYAAKHVLPSTWLIYVSAGLGLACLCFTRWQADKRVFLIGLFIFSVFAVCPGFYFRRHYFVFLAPAIALLAGVTLSEGLRRLIKMVKQPRLYHFAFFLVALVCAQSLCADRAVLFSLSPSEASRAIYGLNLFPESQDIARYIEQNSSKDQHIAVVGDEPQIYFYSHRRASISQIYPSQTMDPRPYAHQMQERMISEMEQTPPAFLVYSSLYSSLLVRKDSDPLLLSWTQNYVRTNMQLVGVIQFTSPQMTEAAWGPAVATTPRASQYFVLVYQALSASDAKKTTDGR